MPVIILGGILSGYFTATEVAAIAVAYSFLIGYFVYGKITLRALPGVLLETATLNCAIMFVFATAYLLSWVVTFAGIPFIVADWLQGVVNSPAAFLLIANLLLRAVGLWMDPGAALVVLIPILMPIAIEMGIHPVHFGLIVSINLIIGMITPPVGYVLYAIAPAANISIERISRANVPFLIIEVLVLLALTYSPQLTLFLPRLFGYVE